MYICVCVHIYIHIYVYTHTHTHIYIYIYILYRYMDIYYIVYIIFKSLFTNCFSSVTTCFFFFVLSFNVYEACDRWFDARFRRI